MNAEAVMQPLEKAPFLSPRNLPFWAGVAFVVIAAAMVVWLG
jgi:hypothetical protein